MGNWKNKKLKQRYRENKQNYNIEVTKTICIQFLMLKLLQKQTYWGVLTLDFDELNFNTSEQKMK